MLIKFYFDGQNGVVLPILHLFLRTEFISGAFEARRFIFSHPELVSGSLGTLDETDSETSVLDYAGLQVLFFISKKLCFFCIQINFAADEFRAAHSLYRKSASE